MQELYFFTGSHCPSCKSVKQQLQDKLNGNGDRIKYFNVDNPGDAKVAAQYGVMSLPTIICMDGGNPVHSYIGSNAVNKLVEDGVLS